MGCGPIIRWTSRGLVTLWCSALGVVACSGSSEPGSPNNIAGNTSQSGNAGADVTAGKSGSVGGAGGSTNQAGAGIAAAYGGDAPRAGRGGTGDATGCGANQPCSNAGDECFDGGCRTPPKKPAAPCQYRYNAGHDYYFCDVKVDHAAAAAACSAVKMTLVHINDKSENDFINRTIATEACCAVSVTPSYHWAGLWIGATDAMMKADWHWDDDKTRFWQGLGDGMAVDGAFASWDMGQPNNGNLGPDEYCVRTKGGLWNDTPCDTDLFAEYPFDGIGYVCES